MQLFMAEMYQVGTARHRVPSVDRTYTRAPPLYALRCLLR